MIEADRIIDTVIDAQKKKRQFRSAAGRHSRKDKRTFPRE